MSANLLPEIRHLLEAKLARYGVAGRVQLDEQNVSVSHGNALASVPIGTLAQRWGGLGLEQREYEVAHLARELQRQLRPAPARIPQRRSPLFGGLVAVGLVLAAAAGYYRLQGGAGPKAIAARAAAAVPDGPAPLDADVERRERAAQACTAARARLARGGTLGPADVEGWVVELSLVRPRGPAGWPSLSTFLSPLESTAGDRISWSGAPQLSQLDGGATRVEVDDAPSTDEGTPQFLWRRLTFLGHYVAPYFREREQIQLVRLAHALAEQQQATLGALYARCATGSQHHMGSWFLGTSPGAAAASLLFFMGAYSEPAPLPREVLSSRADRTLEPEFALRHVLEKTQRLGKQELASWIGPQDGTVAGPAHFTTLAFPFVESDRALVASHSLARLFVPAPEQGTKRRRRRAR